MTNYSSGNIPNHDASPPRIAHVAEPIISDIVTSYHVSGKCVQNTVSTSCFVFYAYGLTAVLSASTPSTPPQLPAVSDGSDCAGHRRRGVSGMRGGGTLIGSGWIGYGVCVVVCSCLLVSV